MCAALSLSASIPRIVHGQRVLGVGDDATVLRRGTVRVTAGATWATYNELYGPGGKLEALGAPFFDSFTRSAPARDPRPLRTTLRTLAQLPTADVSLGPARTDYSARIARSEIDVDFGLTSRIMLTGRLPYEHTVSEVVFDVNPRNELANRPNLGINPALAAGGAAVTLNRGVVDSLLRAAQAITTRLDGCAASNTDPICGDQSRARTLVNDARAFAAGIATTYGIGADTARGSAVVPMANSTLQTAIAARVTALNASFKTYIPDLAAWNAPAPAQAPLSAGQANELVADALGIGPLGVVERSHLGDIEVGAKVLLIDTFGSLERSRSPEHVRGVRLSVGGLGAPRHRTGRDAGRASSMWERAMGRLTSRGAVRRTSC